MKLTKHSKVRMKERTNLNHRERRQLFKNALEHGKSPYNIKNEKIKKYMLARQNNCKIKLYKDYLFIYSKNTKILYTMYKLPEELLEGDDK